MIDCKGKTIRVGDYVHHLINNYIGKITGKVNANSVYFSDGIPSIEVIAFINTTRYTTIWWCKNVELLSDEEAMLWMLEN